MAKPFESKIQDLVYNVEVGVGLHLIKALLYILFVCSVFVIYTATQYVGFGTPESMEYAQLGRNVAQRGSLTTQVVRPLSMWYLIEHKESSNPALHRNPRIDQHPDILHAPLYPLALGAAFKVSNTQFPPPQQSERKYGPEKKLIVPLNLLFASLSGLLMYLLGLRLFDKRVALIAATVFFLSNSVWKDAISGLPISMALFWGTLAVYMAVLAVSNRQDQKAVWTWLLPFLVSSVACLLLFLTRYPGVALLPGLMLFIGLGFKKRGWIYALVMLAICIGGASPWVLRNIKVCDSPFGLAPLMMFESENAVLSHKLAPGLEKLNTWQTVKVKLKHQFANNLEKSPQLLGGGFLIVCFFAVTYFFGFKRRQVQILRWGIALSYLIMLIVGSLYGEGAMNIAHILTPVVILYGVAFFFVLQDRLNIKIHIVNMAITSLLVLFSALPLIATITPPRPSGHYPPYLPPQIYGVSNFLKPDELMCTDMPWATAWYGNRNSLLLPASIDDFYHINDFRKQISGLYFTSITRNKPYIGALKAGLWNTWFPIMELRIPGDFPLKDGRLLQHLDQLFLFRQGSSPQQP